MDLSTVQRLEARYGSSILAIRTCEPVPLIGAVAIHCNNEWISPCNSQRFYGLEHGR